MWSSGLTVNNTDGIFTLSVQLCFLDSLLSPVLERSASWLTEVTMGAGLGLEAKIAKAGE